ncbi:hypothetical protein [Hyalangium versicolor]|uniref:hypothetical protein n=1 Tax=Hyalangium versicolor TaxID=2861190 RepID=UPI001CCA399E|nr:hypothetical protein [Hyalangium versicolor]
MTSTPATTRVFIDIQLLAGSNQGASLETPAFNASRQGSCPAVACSEVRAARRATLARRQTAQASCHTSTLAARIEPLTEPLQDREEASAAGTLLPGRGA